MRGNQIVEIYGKKDARSSHPLKLRTFVEKEIKKYKIPKILNI